MLQVCKHDIRAATREDSNDAIVLFRNLLLDPVYLDMVLFLFSSAKYNSIVYNMESYIWVQPSSSEVMMSGSLQSQTALVENMPLLNNISRQIHASIRCALVLESELLLSPSARKTDLYNISKLRSFVYTSLQTLAIHNVDIIARPRHFSMSVHNSRLNDTEMKDNVRQSLDLCIVDATAPETQLEFTVNRFIQHKTFNLPSAMVTEIRVQNAFCPDARELDCIGQKIGTLVVSPTSKCVADIDILFTSFNPEMMLVKFELYILQIQGYDQDMHLSHPDVCSEVLYIRHKAAAVEYVDIINKQQQLSAMHQAYRANFGTAIIFDSGVHSLGTYNVTMRISSSNAPISMSSAVTIKKNSQRAESDKLHVVRTLNLLGVNISGNMVGTPTMMSMREDTKDLRSIVFSFSGAVIETTDIITLVNSTVWLATSQYATEFGLEIQNFSSSISGSLLFDALSVSEAQLLCMHVDSYKTYYSPVTGPLFSATITQFFVIPSGLQSTGIAVQNGPLQQWVDTSSFVFRVSVRIPIQVNRLNALLVEVLKTVIFTKETTGFAKLSSLSGQNVPVSVDGILSSTEYAFLVYTLPVASIEECDLRSNTNTEDYFLEIGNVVSNLFGVSLGFELYSACLVTNTLHSTVRPPPTAQCGISECNDGIVARYAATNAFLNDSSVTYSERCELRTNLLVTARFDHITNSLMNSSDVMRLKTELTYGNVHDPLQIAMQTTVKVSDNTVSNDELAHVFSTVYSRGSINASAVDRPKGTAGFFALYNDGMSASEKPECISARHYETAAPSIACVQNLSLSQWFNNIGTSCLRFTTLNSRIDLTSLRRFILAKTTAEMLRPTAISIESTLTAHIESMPCEGTVHSLLSVMFQSQSIKSTRLLIERKHNTQLLLVVQHTTPFIQIPAYRSNILRLLRLDDVQVTQWRVSTSVVLHLYTKGITLDVAHAFFAPLLLEYIRSQLQDTTTQIRVKIIDIRPLVQYGSVFPHTLFEKEESRVQLYVQVHIIDMSECAEIQSFLVQPIVQQQMMGMNMQVQIVDIVGARTICSNMVSLEHSSSKACQNTDADFLTELVVSGGRIVSSNYTCSLGTGPECSAVLTSSDVGLFFDSLRIITRAHGLGYYFEHSVDFCGLDGQLLGTLISKESLDFFGTCVCVNVCVDMQTCFASVPVDCNCA